MKTKLLFRVLLFLTIPVIGIGQIGTPPECTTSSAPPNSEEMENVRFADFSQNDYFLKVYVHVLSHTQSGHGQTNMGINESMRRLYDVYDNFGVYLVWDGEVDYIVNDPWFINPQTNSSQILLHNNHTDGIDIYIGPSLNPNAVGHTGGDIGGSTAFIVSGYSNLETNVYNFWPQSPIIVHEMGHVLYLWHTFHGTAPNTGGCPECLLPSNQHQCGDFIDDTPPDPKTGINNNCVYTAGGQDDCDSDFAPLTNNFMNAAPIDCKDDFTPGQEMRMKNAIHLLPILQSTQLQEYTYIRGLSLVCDFSDYEIYSNDAASLIIESSNNIDVTTTSTTNSLIEITIENPDPFALVGQPAWISIKRNEIEQARKDIWIGVPQAVEPNSIFGDTPVNPGDVKDYAITTQLEGTFTQKYVASYFWDLPGFTPTENYPFTNNYSDWQFDLLTKHNFIAHTQVGECSGEIKLYGINECGDGLILQDDDGLDVYVYGGGPNCPADDLDIVYYPNPADDLLQIDLSLQDYKVFDIVVYNNNQVAVYTDQSTNVVKTVDTFNLPNDTYYLHIYDGSELILSKILIINH